MFRNLVEFFEYFRDNIEISSFVSGFIFCMIMDCVNGFVCFLIEKALEAKKNREVMKKEEKVIDRYINK